MKNIKKLFKILKNPRVLRALAIVIAAGAIGSGYLFYQARTGRIFIDNSLVAAPIVSLTPSGEIKRIYVFEGEGVKAGQVLAEVGGQSISSATNGVIVKANNSIGSISSPQNPVIQMINPEDLRIQGTIDENKGLKDIKIGQAVSFSIDAFPGKVYWGYIDEISPTAKQTQMAFSISSERPTQQFDVFARFDPKLYPELKNGMSAKMTIFTRLP
ncbi:MAG: efflux RND transporter periplasmic adaptor subunit [Patescibacteria group bacterium]|nr:efflux RND transporter periplasmic adaptor subunit [Patescibacteria group bacterium]